MPLNHPVGAAEFAAAMARLGPWDDSRRVAVAVSGGADSLALAVLTAGWGSPVAFIVDHGLRPDSGQEAVRTRLALAGRGIAATVLTLSGLRPGPGMPARARAARYAVLEQAAARAGLVDLLLGHHAADQAETVLMRRDSGSGPRGLAGMAALAEGRQVRLVRPLLGIAPARLRATLRDAGLNWVEDPTNQDQRFTRARLRAGLGGALAQPLAAAAAQGRARIAMDVRVAESLGTRATIFPEGYALLTPGPLEPDALRLLLQALSGRPFAPPPGAVAALARCLRPATLGGVRITDAGRLGPGWLLVREAAALAPPIQVAPEAVWDGRFRITAHSAPGTLGALGAQAPISVMPGCRRRCCRRFRRGARTECFQSCHFLPTLPRAALAIPRAGSCWAMVEVPLVARLSWRNATVGDAERLACSHVGFKRAMRRRRGLKSLDREIAEYRWDRVCHWWTRERR